MARTLLMLLAIVLFFSCNTHERRERLATKEARLQQWEEQLKERELAVAQKEEELMRKASQADSLSRDSVAVYEPKLIGKWSVKMTCSETTCQGSAVGDTKSETWEFFFQDGTLIVQALVKDIIARIYIGKSTAEGIYLTEQSSHGNPGKGTKITASLSLTGDDVMEGQREIVREDDCRILYTLQLNRQ